MTRRQRGTGGAAPRRPLRLREAGCTSARSARAGDRGRERAGDGAGERRRARALARALEHFGGGGGERQRAQRGVLGVLWLVHGVLRGGGPAAVVRDDRRVGGTALGERGGRVRRLDALHTFKQRRDLEAAIVLLAFHKRTVHIHTIFCTVRVEWIRIFRFGYNTAQYGQLYWHSQRKFKRQDRNYPATEYIARKASSFLDTAAIGVPEIQVKYSIV